MDKLTILKKIKLDAKSDATIEELEGIIDSFFDLLNSELDKNENINFGDWLHLSSINNSSKPIVNRGNPNLINIQELIKQKYGPIPGICKQPSIIGNLGKRSRKINKF